MSNLYQVYLITDNGAYPLTGPMSEQAGMQWLSAHKHDHQRHESQRLELRYYA